MAKELFNGFTAQALLQGARPVAMLVRIVEVYEWDEAKNKYGNKAGYVLTATSPATRFKCIDIRVPVDGCHLGITDTDIEKVASSGGVFPFVKFEGLTIEQKTTKDSSNITRFATATMVCLCDESGNPKK